MCQATGVVACGCCGAADGSACDCDYCDSCGAWHGDELAWCPGCESCTATDSDGFCLGCEAECDECGWRGPVGVACEQCQALADDAVAEAEAEVEALAEQLREARATLAAARRARKALG